MSSWSCPHDLDGICQKVAGAVCDPGMRGCMLHGRFVFADAAKNRPRKPQRAQPPSAPAAPAKPKRRLPF